MEKLKLLLLALSKVKGLSRIKKREVAERIINREKIADEIIEKMESESVKVDLEKEISYLKKIGAHFVTIFEEGYPSLLRQIPDCPIILYVKGSLLIGENTIGIVGSRRASYEGMNMAEKIGETLSSVGITVVSGLARGIDAAAHKGALMGKGGTVAVLGCGIDICYPSENRWLYNRISEQGLILSEYAPGEPPLAHHFPERNRIIAGISKAILVVEASKKSGALITASLALDYGRDVMAIPGSVFDDAYAGTNSLIKEGARLVDSVEDILEFSFPNIKPERKDSSGLEKEELIVYSIIKNTRVHVEEIISKSRMDSSKVLAILTKLEMKGLVKCFPGGFYLRS
ncbi:MAG: DNA-processing protein DprA [Deltaproteobacteria bacterium]|nr:DNA-processing protein DprA [Deltaproteobacteria bacterium]